MFTETMTQALAIMDVINSTNITNANSNSAGLDMSEVKRCRYFLKSINLGAAGTLDARLQSSPNSNFNVVHNITNTNIVQVNTNNVISTIEVRSDQVTQQNNGDRFVRLQMTGGGNAITVDAFGLGGESIQSPASQFGLGTNFVQQAVVCNT